MRGREGREGGTESSPPPKNTTFGAYLLLKSGQHRGGDTIAQQDALFVSQDIKKATRQPSPFKTKATFGHFFSHYHPFLSSPLRKGKSYCCRGGESVY